MPRSVAAMLGLILVALSIGVNTARYPVVWEMVGASRVCEPAQSVALLHSEEGQSSAKPLPHPIPPIDVGPVSELTKKPVVDGEVPHQSKLVAQATPREPAAEPRRNKPLVPVVPVSSRSAKDSAGAIRRLPPVGRTGMMPGGDLSQFFGPSIPIYPTTGIE